MTRAVRIQHPLHFDSQDCAWLGLPWRTVDLAPGLVDLGHLRSYCSYRRHLNAIRRAQRAQS